MSNGIPTRPGQVNGAGDARALFLRKFSGEVMAAFAMSTQFVDKTLTRTITGGRSAQFPAWGRGTAGYHTPGTALQGTTVNTNERVIEIDDKLVADRFVADIDEAMNHYEFRSILARDMGERLAVAYDRNVAQVGILAARAAATVTGLPAGLQIVSQAAQHPGNDASVLIDTIFAAARRLDENDVPKSERYIFVRPQQYYLLVNSGSRVIDTDFNPGGNGSIGQGKIVGLAGMPIIMTNNLVAQNVTTGPTAYRGDFTKTAALVLHRSAVGTVKLMDLRMQSEDQVWRQGTLLVASYAVGHGILRPEASVEINIGTQTFPA